jgi:hypothetical protein
MQPFEARDMPGAQILRVARYALIAVIVVTSVAMLSAQTVVDPRTVEFNPSPDHNATTSTGAPLVTSYSLSLYQQGAGTPFATVSLGKPAPAADGKIRVDFIALLSSVPAPNVTYEARVSAVGPGGATPSSVSNGFSFSAVCSYAISPATLSAAATGATGTFAMTAGTGCTWTAASSVWWLTVTSGGSGSGNGTIGYSVAANTTTTQRTGSITVGGRTFSVTQAAAPCTFDIVPNSVAAPATGTSGSFSMNAGTGCTWTASSNASWLTVTGGASGSGNGTTNFSVAPNTSTTPRSGTIAVAGLTFTVSQSGAPCSYTLTPGSQSLASSASTGSFALGTSSGCAWTASSNAGWLTVTSAASGSGNATINFSAAANPNTTIRTATIAVGGQAFAVTQAAAPCTFSLSPTSQSAASGGGPGSFAVATSSSCSWTATSNAAWLTVTGSPGGTGNGTVNFSAAANQSTASRSATITVNGQTFTLTQAGACSFAIAPGSQSVAASGGTGSFALTAAAGCAWTASDNASWITLTTPTSGSGNATIGFSVPANPNSSQRTGLITVGGQTFTVSQTGTTCSYSVAPLSQSVGASGGSGAAAVTSAGGCMWTAAAAVPWITVTAGGSGTGNGTVNFSVAANAETAARTGTLTIAGDLFTVNQAAAPCTYGIAPSGQSFVSGGGGGSFAVTAGNGCSWSAASGAGWITVSGAGTGSGNGTVAFSVAANGTSSDRSGSITVNGQTFTVTQAAPCTYGISPASQSVASSGGTGSFNVTAGGSCGWTATSSAGWLTVTGTPAGSGSGTVSFSAAANPNATSRTATISVGGQTFTVAQAATSTCTFSIAPTSRTMSSSGGSSSIAVTTQAGCAWTAVPNNTWLSIILATGNGNGTATFRATPNTAGPRTGSLTVAGYAFTVNQNGTCTYTVAPTSLSVAGAGSSGQISMTTGTGCVWSAATSVPWISINGTSGSGTGTVGYTVAPNTTGSIRFGFLTVGTRSISVSQPAGSGPVPPSMPGNLRIVGGAYD